MQLPEYFIKHPIIALVLNCMIAIMGWLCLHTVSIREYPEVKIPIFSIQTDYPNASAEQIESNITDPLEDQLAGIEDLDYMISKSKPGSSSIELFFKEGISVEATLNSIREAVVLARSSLPKESRDPRIEKQRESTNGLPFIAIALTAKDQDKGALAHYAESSLKNAFRSLHGVSSVQIWAPRYTMFVRLDPKKMYALGVNVQDVYESLEKATQSWPIGKYRETFPTIIETTLSTPEDFSQVVVKENEGSPIYLDSISTIQLSIEDNTYRARVNGQPALIIAIQKANDANPIEVSKAVQDQVSQLQKSLPTEYEIKVVLDNADFIRVSLEKIKSTLLEAAFFVGIIIFLFLGNIRATFIPLITIPISLIGGIIFIKLCGFSLNIITLLAMVLGTGLVVDDAIVVLENISRHIESGMSSLEAALKGSREIGFAIIAMTFTLASVYLPLAFIQGTTGQLFSEFAVMLAGSVFISGIVALTLSPTMSMFFLKKPSSISLTEKIFSIFTRIETLYAGLLKTFFTYKKYTALFVLFSISCIFLFFHILPKESSPPEDRSLIGVYVPSIPGKNLDELEQFVLDIEKELMPLPEAKACLTFMGDWGASVILPLKPHKERRKSAREIIFDITPKMSSYPSADAWPWSSDSGLPGVNDTGNTSEIVLAISTLGNYRNLLNVINKIRENIDQKHLFRDVHHNLKLDTQGYKITLNSLVLSRLGIASLDVAKTIEVFFSGNTTLRFQKDSLFYPITIKGEDKPWTLDELYIFKDQQNAKNKETVSRISLGTLATLSPNSSPKELLHFNQMRSAFLTANLEKGQSYSSSMETLLQAVKEHLPSDYKTEWTGSTRQYLESSSTMFMLLGLALVFIFAILAIQFESLVDPLIIMISVPLACFGALVTIYCFQQTINIYTQIGLITLIGLITKHGILIVEFANQLRKENLPLEDAIQRAAKLRLRPILMTTAAMILGALPLILTRGAGQEARYAIGIVIIGGLTFGTLFTLFILPQIYYLVKFWVHRPID